MALDQCEHCQAKGNLQKCEATPCSKHDSWYAQELKTQIVELVRIINKVPTH